jgi:transcriptional regulator GlxA family with amidase domain
MKHLSILVPEGQNNLSSIVGAYKLFSKANEYWKSSENNPKPNSELFLIQVLGLSKQVGFYNDLFAVKPHTFVSDIDKTNLIIIPSLNHQYEEAIQKNEDIVEWIELQYKLGAEVASICTGAFLLASTGLLDGKSCSTHWSAQSDFRAKFPNVKLKADGLITDENGIYTNGGAYSFLNLMIYLIEKYYDRETAIYCSKVFQIEIDRNKQSEFAIFTGQKSHGDEMIEKAQLAIESQLNEKISIEKIASQFAISRRNFDRRFVKATGVTPTEYVHRAKIELAKKGLESTRKSVAEVMYEVAYTDVKAFREVFRKITGLSPNEYKNKYNKNLV